MPHDLVVANSSHWFVRLNTKLVPLLGLNLVLMEVQTCLSPGTGKAQLVRLRRASHLHSIHLLATIEICSPVGSA